MNIGERPGGNSDELGRALGPAVRSQVDDPVDTDLLLAGARAGARRIRHRRRTATVAAVVAVLAVPAAYLLRPPGKVDVQPAPPVSTTSSVTSSPPTPSVTPSARPTDLPTATTTATASGERSRATRSAEPTESPSESVATADPTGGNSTGTSAGHPAPTSMDRSSTANAYALPPGEQLLRGGEVPASMQLLYSDAVYRNIAIVSGQTCNLGRDGLEPAAGSSVMWAEDGADNANSRALELNVTGYLRGQGRTALQELRTGTARCSYEGTWRAIDTQYDEAVTSTENGQRLVVVRVADLLVGVRIGNLAGPPPEASEAVRLADLAASRLVAAGTVGSTP